MTQPDQPMPVPTTEDARYQVAEITEALPSMRRTDLPKDELPAKDQVRNWWLEWAESLLKASDQAFEMALAGETALDESMLEQYKMTQHLVPQPPALIVFPKPSS